MAVELPNDVLHLIFAELGQQRDFGSLYSCAISGRKFASFAIENLYRIYTVAPITAGESDEFAEQKTVTRKWALLWRVLTLSSLGKTAFPYCRYIRALDLRDLAHLLEDRQFPSRMFFAGDLRKFKVMGHAPANEPSQAYRQLDVKLMTNAIGEAITKEAPLLETLSGDILPDSLPKWTARLPRLQSLELWQGQALAQGADTIIQESCPRFTRLSIYNWLGGVVDQELSKFLRGLRPQSLKYFETISTVDFGPLSCKALSSHCHALRELHLSNLTEHNLVALSHLHACTLLEVIYLEELRETTDLKRTQNDSFVRIVDWLCSCKSLRTIQLDKIRSSTDILIPVLSQESLQLRQVTVSNYVLYGARPRLFQALSHQTSLEQLRLISARCEDSEGNHEPEPSDIQSSVDELCHLTTLRHLWLGDVSEPFRNEHISQIAGSLHALEDFWISGTKVTDSIWDDIGRMRNLKSLTFGAFTQFSVDGILHFASQLGPKNSGFALALLNQDPQYKLNEHEESLIREVFAVGVNGKFEFMLSQDYSLAQEGSDFDGESESESD